MMRTYTMRLKTTKRQDVVLTDLLGHLCVLYNSALEHRVKCWKTEKKSVSYYDQQLALTEFRHTSPEVAAYPVKIQRDPLRRVNTAFRKFFDSFKVGGNHGYPRFKSRTQYKSFTVECGRFRMESDSIVIARLGGFKFKTKYKIKGEPKLLHVQRKGNRWIANVSCDIGDAPDKIEVGSAIGIDLGLTTLATLSDGTEIANPRWTRQEEDRLAEANRDLSRRKNGSRNRSKSKERLRRIYQRIAGLRSSYTMSVAKSLFAKYDLIAHEKLDIRELKKKFNLGKSISDAAWASLIWKLQCEAEKAGKWLIPVNPRNTTKTCSGCGELVPKTLRERQHHCPACGLSLGRDHNAALNILRLGESLVSKQDQTLVSA